MAVYKKFAQYRVAHTQVGPWPQGTVLTHEELTDHPGMDDPKEVHRLIALGAVEKYTAPDPEDESEAAFASSEDFVPMGERRSVQVVSDNLAEQAQYAQHESRRAQQFTTVHTGNIPDVVVDNPPQTPSSARSRGKGTKFASTPPERGEGLSGGNGENGNANGGNGSEEPEDK